MSKRYVVSLTMEQAVSLGIVKCESCGWPENNHFDFDERKCAHTDKCTGWKPRFVVGRPIVCNKQKRRQTKRSHSRKR